MNAEKDPKTDGATRKTDGATRKENGAAPDVVSDPAQSTEDRSSDWTDEGGATPSGPATDTDED